MKSSTVCWQPYNNIKLTVNNSIFITFIYWHSNATLYLDFTLAGMLS